MANSLESTPLKYNHCLLVEDNLSVKSSMENLLAQNFPNITITSTTTLKESEKWINDQVQLSGKPQIDFALIDLGLPDGTGIDLIRLLKRQNPQTTIVVITIYDDDHYLFPALSAGASGYLLKENDHMVMGEALKKIETGEPPLSPSIAHRLLSYFHAYQAPETNDDLTPREKETLTLIARGLTVTEAAKSMGLSAQTVASYVKIIYQKLHVSNRAEVTRVALKRGLI